MSQFAAVAAAELIVVILIFVGAAVIVNIDAIFYALGALGQ